MEQVTVQQNGTTKTVGAHNAWIGYAGAAGTDLRSEFAPYLGSLGFF